MQFIVDLLLLLRVLCFASFVAMPPQRTRLNGTSTAELARVHAGSSR